MSQTKALITGINGFCGRQLTSFLLQQGYRMVGMDLKPDPVPDAATLYAGDIRDDMFVSEVLEATRPDIIFHLAALTAPRANPEELESVNKGGTRCLLDAVQCSSSAPRIVITSSSAVYGHVLPAQLPIRETQPLRPATAYAASKVLQEREATQAFIGQNLAVICIRPFNLTGPGESEHFVTSAFARQIAEIEAGLRAPIIQVGNLDAVRDFTDVRDAVRAYVLLAERGIPGEVYNVCSEQGVQIRQILELLLELSTRTDIEIRVDPTRLQAADVPIQIGSAARLRALTGWAPTLTLTETLNDLLNSWRQRIYEEQHL
ncbi:MAG: GDP-mannose 4,6-dehydratase [Anaerolineae bacterium]|nr:GDP-mannose 4,6-dehydratase [Anaerolineae bacterium]